MGAVHIPLPVKLLMPMLSADTALFEIAEQSLVDRFGSVDYRSPCLPFDYTTYYDREFGSGIQRKFLAFKGLVDPGRLAEIKLVTKALEKTWSEEGRRRINLDPGYLCAAKLVLATTKNQAHRIYLGRGIYAEVTLSFYKKAFHPCPWTYPDYRTETYLKIMQEIRGIYMGQIKGLG